VRRGPDSRGRDGDRALRHEEARCNCASEGIGVSVPHREAMPYVYREHAEGIVRRGDGDAGIARVLRKAEDHRRPSRLRRWECHGPQWGIENSLVSRWMGDSEPPPPFRGLRSSSGVLEEARPLPKHPLPQLPAHRRHRREFVPPVVWPHRQYHRPAEREVTPLPPLGRERGL